MSGLFWNTITHDMRLVLQEFFRSGIAERFYLAGGTALSLQIGHRQSIDLDLFSQTEDIPTLRASLEKSLASLEPTLADSSWGNLVFTVQNVRVGFYGYGYEMVKPFVEENGVRLASVEDIALMKLDALLARASRKDFYDLYFILQTVPLQDLFGLAPKKYPSVRDFEVQATKRLVYFSSADLDPDPILIKPVPWGTVKEYFIGQAKEIEQGWLR